MKARFKRTKFTIKSEDADKIHGGANIRLDDEENYNKMIRAMLAFNESLLNPLHKPFQMRKTLTFSNTVAASGLFGEARDMPKHIAEADISKAFTEDHR